MEKILATFKLEHRNKTEQSLKRKRIGSIDGYVERYISIDNSTSTSFGL
jgi:hypothetical protein